MSIVNVLHSKDAINSKYKINVLVMGVCIVRIILKNIGMASEKLYRNTLRTVREVFRGRVGCLEPVFSRDGT